MEMSYTFNTAGDVIKALKEKYKKVIAMGDKGGLIIEDSNIREFGDVYTYSKWISNLTNYIFLWYTG